MSKKTIYSLGILLTILIGTYFYWKFCCGGALSADGLQNKEYSVDTDAIKDGDGDSPTRKATGFPFTFSDPNGDFSFTSDENFNFEASGFNILRPISEDIKSGIDELQLYLGGDESKLVDITGMYTSGEENTSAFPNLGMARANSVKNYMISRGIPSSRMNLFGALSDDLIPDEKIYRGPINFGISSHARTSAEIDKADLEALRKKIQTDPLILYFAKAQTSIDLSEVQRQKFADIARYLDLAEGGNAVVTGHTDNTGSKAGNISIGQKRANFAKRYLVQNGISEAKIDATSKGSNEPIGSNATEEGRAQNRRTVVTVN